MKTDTQAILAANLEVAKRDLARAQAAVATHTDLTPEQQLAVDLHDVQCNMRHDLDGCGWTYEGRDAWKVGYTHTEYLRKARKALKVADAETIIRVVKALVN